MIFQGYSQKKKKEVANKIKNGKERTDKRQKKVILYIFRQKSHSALRVTVQDVKGNSTFL